MAIQLKYIEENKPYQKLLDKKYSGKVLAVDQYVNGKAIIRHYCISCRHSFHARPGYLINLESGRHYCSPQEPEELKTAPKKILKT